MVFESQSKTICLINQGQQGTSIFLMPNRRSPRGAIQSDAIMLRIFVIGRGGFDLRASCFGRACSCAAIEKDLLSRAERRSLKSRWRRERERATPSPSALSGWLKRFHDPNSPKAVAGKAFIPAVTQALRGLWRVNQALLEFLHEHQPAKSATLDMDATLIETHKRDALHASRSSRRISR